MTGNANPLNFDKTREAIRDDHGYTHERSYAPSDFTLPSGVGLAAAADNIVGLAAVTLGGSSVSCVQWDDTADASDQAMLSLFIDGHYNEDADKIQVVLRVRKFDSTGSATDNADLRLDCTPKAFRPLDDEAAALTAVQKTLAAKNAGTEWEDFEEIVYELSGNGLKRGSRIDLLFNPHETVGTALFIHCLGAIVRTCRCSALFDRSDRDLTRLNPRSA